MWTVAITAGEAEFLAASSLRVDGLDVFLPYIRERLRVRLPTRGRALYNVMVSDVPRWPRYLFVGLGEDDPNETLALVRKNRLVRDLVHFGDSVATVSDKVIVGLRQGCLPDGRLMRNSSLYNVGDILRFVSPSLFEGRRGEVLRLDETDLTMVVDHRNVTTPYAEVAPIA